jgi:hypothetical protein
MEIPMTFFIEKKITSTIYMESQETMNSQRNSEQEKSRHPIPNFKTIQRYSDHSSMVSSKPTH